MKRFVVPFLILLSLLAVVSALSAAPLTGRVVSDAGQGLPARVLVILPQTRESAEVYTTPDGRFSMDAPAGKLQIIATHGPEWSIAEIQAQAGDNCTLTLSRLVDMPARGYYGADLHMHSTFSDGKQTPTEIAYHCQAEGLEIAALTDHDCVAQQPEWLAHARPGFLPLRGDEITTVKGHILGINITKNVSNDVTHGAADFTRIFRQVHEQGGLAIVAHPNALSIRYQYPEVRDYDAYEILNGSIPPYGALFDAVQARTSWHAMLSAGRKVAAVGDSDNHDNFNTLGRQILQHPEKASQLDPRMGMLLKLVNFDKTIVPWGWKGLHPGIYRTYLLLPKPSPEAVAEAVKAGRGFVTNGPLILATLDNQPPGAEVKVGDRPSLTLKAELIANRPLEKLVVIVNDKPTLTMQTNGTLVQMTVPVKAGDWVTAELYGPWPEFATTNAWYVR